MYEALIIAISCAVSIAFLSKANIKITINHVYPQANTPAAQPEMMDMDELYKEANLPTFDDVLKVAQDLIGGEQDDD